MSKLIARLLAATLALGAAVVGHPAAARQAPAAPDPASMWKSLPGLRSTPPTARTLELARELLTLERQGMTDDELDRRWVAAAGKLSPAPPGALEAMQEARRSAPDLVQGMRERTAEVYARNYTDDELSTLIGYLTHPIGHTVHQARLEAIGAAPAQFTPEQQAWIRDFEEGQMGRALTAKKPTVLMLVSMATMDLSDQLARRAAAIHCARKTCSQKARRRVSANP